MLILNGQTSASILTLMPLPSEYQLDIPIKRDYSRIHRIKNPLLGIPEDQLLADVEEFAREKDLTDILPLLQKGALVAQNPTSFETIKDIVDCVHQLLEVYLETLEVPDLTLLLYT